MPFLVVESTDLELMMARPALAIRDHERELVRRQPLSIQPDGGESVDPLLQPKRPHVREGLAEDLPRHLVEEHERPFVIHDEHGRGKLVREVTGQDQDQASLLHPAHPLAPILGSP